MAYEVFVSYATQDLGKVKGFLDQIGAHSVRVFVAEHSVEPGESLEEEIFTAIEECDLFILFWSSHSKESDWVSREIDKARRESKRIIPVVLEHGVKPLGALADTKYLTAYENFGKAQRWLQDHVLERSRRQKQRENLVLLAVAWGLLALIGRGK